MYYIPEHRERMMQKFTACAEQGIPYDEELQIVAADGQRRWVRSVGQPLYDNRKRIIGVSGACQDVTQRRERERELRKLAYITEQSPAPITVTDLKGKMEYVNAAFEKLSGYSRDELLGKTSAYIQSGNTPDATYKSLWQAISTGQVWTGEIQNRRKDGSLYWEHELISPLKDDLGQVANFVAIKQDITAVKEAQQELRRLAFEDALTGLYSRGGFTQVLETRLEKEGWLADGIVATIDIVGLRDINDAYGHNAGDQLLKEFGRRLTQRADETRLTGRIGGDEFIVFLSPDCTRTEEERLEQLLNELTQPMALEGTQIEISIRLGYTPLNQPERSIQSLLREAERALSHHRTKLSEPWVAYDGKLQEDSRLRIQLTRELHQALKDDQFELHYQPKVDLETGHLIACEALLRWHHPELGLISPGVFIPIAEQSQLIAPIGAWVLRNACQQLQAWRASGLQPVSVAVNISLIQFQTGSLPHQVKRILDETGASPNELVLELTESVFSDATTSLLDQMHALREMGLRLSLDDFGTGYSSLLYLQQYPVDEIKIDQGFVFQLRQDSFSRQLVKAVLMIAESLQADVLAEGIETADIGETLRAMGCRFGQGY
ncbi:EAL domain-containing protein [Halomonas sp. TBZ9]|uniref:EAL domain-containing protein n=1 Tax=Vreelandella azerica TaxID=2732867 RepID=A0A7Y3TYP2_9GAMM|nr:GGDEF domain-containing phosphodiesterase [Halomonas azerica]NOG32499.1 EAL domain-containing protein [Halomonas azerica]